MPQEHSIEATVASLSNKEPHHMVDIIKARLGFSAQELEKTRGDDAKATAVAVAAATSSGDGSSSSASFNIGASSTLSL